MSTKKIYNYCHAYCKCDECKRIMDWSIFKSIAKHNMKFLNKLKKP